MSIETVEGLSMGGTWRLRLPLGQTDPRGIVQAGLDLVEGQMSAWRATSALNQINASPLGQWVPVPAETAAVIGAGLDLMRLAPDAFSILMGGAQAADGFIPGRVCPMGHSPDLLELRGHCARRHADFAIDLNAIAKGFAADLVSLMLTEAGYSDFLIEVAGDIVARGQRPDGLPWTVALELPVPDRMIAARLIPLFNSAIATSGGYRRSIGARSHLRRPGTGHALTGAPASVAVLAATGMQADGWATVMAVLGAERGLKLAASVGLAVVFIDTAPDGFRETGSPVMDALLDQIEA